MVGLQLHLRLRSMASLVQAGGATSQAVHGVSSSASPPLLVKWLCLCLGRLVEDQPELLSQARLSAFEPHQDKSTSISAMRQSVVKVSTCSLRREDQPELLSQARPCAHAPL